MTTNSRNRAGLFGKCRCIYDMAIARGLQVIRLKDAWHIRGPGVDLHARRLEYLAFSDLLPARPSRFNDD